jgi:choline-glycine betaine transporter
LTALLVALVIAIAIAIGSISSGIERGVKWTSQLGITLSFGLLVVFVVFGGGTAVIGLFVESASGYLRDLPSLIFTVYDADLAVEADQSAWQGTWTIFYWAWWIAFAPFVGLFLARISKGRTVREFILGAMLGPTAMCFIWFAGTGGSVLLLELESGTNGVIANTEHAFRIYAAVELMLSPTTATVVKAVISLLFLVLIVASSTAAILAIKSIGAAGTERSETTFHSLSWAVIIASVAGAVMAVGGVGAIRDFMIAGAVPFSAIMALMLISICKMLREDGQN